MVDGEIDKVNVASIIAAPVAAAAELKVFTVGTGVNSLIDFNLSDVLYTVGSYIDITPALLIFVASVLGLVTQGELDRGDFSNRAYGVIVGLLGLLPAIQLIGPLSNFVDSTPIVAVLLWLGIATGITYISLDA